MFEFRYTTTSGVVALAKDFPLNAAYAGTWKRGDVVKLSAGQVVAAVAGDAAVLGVICGVNFEGQGVAPVTAKVHVAKEFVYEVAYVGVTKTTLTQADVGSTFDLGANAGVINLDDVTGGFAKVIGFDNAKKTAYVQLTNLIYA